MNTTNLENTQPLNKQAKKVIISLNPKAGSGPSGQLAAELRNILNSQGFEAEVETDLPSIVSKAKLAVAENNLRCVVGVGGDGTQTLMLNELPPEANLCVFPQGTENVLAKYFQLPQTSEEVADLVTNGRVAQIDAGRITDCLLYTSPSPRDRG